MNARLMLCVAALAPLAGCPSALPVPDDDDSVVEAPDPFIDLDPDPDVFEANLTAREAVLPIGDELVTVLTYGGRLPGPEIRVKRGDRVRIHLDNELPEGFPTTIHWHGIEGTNAMDGTPVTQEPVPVGGSFTYDFVAPRPGVYWYHPHVRGAQSVHSGLYAPLIVEDPDEAVLQAQGILPEARQTLVLSDMSLWNGALASAEVANAMAIMNGLEGDHLLVNGQVEPTFTVPAGQGIRLQLINASITRFFVLSVPGHTLYRVGGEGSLLDAVRIEGGSVTGTVETLDGAVIGEEQVWQGYDPGEILLGPAGRADVVLVPTGVAGDRVTLRWEDYARGRHGMWMEGDVMVMGDAEDDGQRPGVDIATFEIVEGDGSSFAIAQGDPLLTAVGRSVELVDVSGVVIDFTGPNANELQEEMAMWQDEAGIWQMDTSFSIDDVSWHPEPSGPSQPEAATARHVRVGDVIRWEVRNATMMAHPWHPHGFSYQPVGFARLDYLTEDGEGAEPATVTRWALDHREMQDVTVIPAFTSLFYSVRIDDPNGDGGAVGRWLEHCHIFQHGESGMMTELIVAP